ncbi:metallophosphoesterase [Methanobacterium sp. MBAC-LM]|uniref:metallophosphoesterase n=1 Tax=Methanobacterium sp. MBAC-LM TaxID=3412034 RepID=UPI003C709DA5
MRRIIQLALFLSVFFLGFLAIDYYIFNRLGMLLGVSQTIITMLVIIFTAAYPVAAILEGTLSNEFTRIIYMLSATWMGVALVLGYTLLGYEIVNFVFNIPPFTAGIAVIIVASVISAYSIFNGLYLNIREIDIPISNLERELRIAQISDTHIGPIRNSGFMKEIVKKISLLNPDIVLITGDLVEGTVGLHSSMFDSINKLKSQIFFVTGNHDMYEGLENVFEVLKTTNINILRNEVVEFEGLQIVGVGYSTQRNYLKTVLPGLNIDKSKPSLLMYHVPIEVEFASEAGIDLQLSGHTHKGQIFPLNFLGRLVFPYFHGLYNYNGTQVYVSPGTGTWGPPMRSGSRSEITLINLKKK